MIDVADTLVWWREISADDEQSPLERRAGEAALEFAIEDRGLDPRTELFWFMPVRDGRQRKWELLLQQAEDMVARRRPRVWQDPQNLLGQITCDQSLEPDDAPPWIRIRTGLQLWQTVWTTLHECYHLHQCNRFGQPRAAGDWEADAEAYAGMHYCRVFQETFPEFVWGRKVSK